MGIQAGGGSNEVSLTGRTGGGSSSLSYGGSKQKDLSRGDPMGRGESSRASLAADPGAGGGRGEIQRGLSVSSRGIQQRLSGPGWKLPQRSLSLGAGGIQESCAPGGSRRLRQQRLPRGLQQQRLRQSLSAAGRLGLQRLALSLSLAGRRCRAPAPPRCSCRHRRRCRPQEQSCCHRGHFVAN